MIREKEREKECTLLRIKRKRTEEPLDALVIDSRTRKKKSPGVFKFAQTVEQDAWDDEQRRRDLEEQISKLAREDAVKAALPMPSPVKEPGVSLEKAPVSRPKEERRYQIITENAADEDAKRKPLANLPNVVSVQDSLPTESVGFKLYDAVLAPSDLPEPILDPEMEKFLPMLNDYLSLHEMPEKFVGTESNERLLHSASADDFVWDVFFHRPAPLADWDGPRATLIGFPRRPISELNDSDFESGKEDNDDEDSNSEGFYKNEYPEEPSDGDDSDGSDMFHECFEQPSDDDDSLPWR